MIDASLQQNIPRSRIYWEKIDQQGLFEGMKPYIMYFKARFPLGELKHIVSCTNEEIVRRSKGEPITEHDLYQYFGIRLAMALNPLNGAVADFWKTEDDEESMTTCRDYERRTGITYTQFAKIEDCLRLDSYVLNGVNEVIV